ncbi:MAG: PPC domain-containing protein, partial [Planctomycetota bacterium]
GYRLHIGTFPRPIAVLPSGGVVGNVLEAKLFDVDGSTSSATVELPDEPVEYWPVTTQTPQGISPSPNWVRVSEYPVVMEAEPNNDYRKGQSVAVPALLCGVINQANDFDCFTFDAKKGQQLRVTVHARQKLRSPLDPVLNVFGPDNKTIKSSDDIGYNRDGTVDVSVKADGPHTIRVYDHLRGGSDLHHYVVSVEPITPGFKIDLKEVRRDEAVTVPVPAGGRGAMVVRVQRDRFNEEINFEVDDLPEGVTAQTFPMPKGRVEIPILLAAAADAQLEGKLFNVRGIGVAGSTEANGDLKQHHKLVLGQNRRELFGYEADRAALAVVKPMPFEMEFVQPKTPILRRGSKELVVRVDRKDFTGRIYFKTLYYPPGVGVNNSKRLEADQTEVTIPITANKNAAIGNWPLILQVSYGTSGGTTTVASPPIDLAVEDAAFNLTFPRIAGEQGTSISLTVGIDAIRDVAGEVTMTLVGLPNGVSSPQPTQPVAKGAESVTFPLVIDPKAKTGRHKTLNVQTRIVRGGETMVQTDGTGEIRIDQPLPAKKQPEKKAAPKKVDPKKPATKKPLSRLEQLRQLKEAS